MHYNYQTKIMCTFDIEQYKITIVAQNLCIFDQFKTTKNGKQTLCHPFLGITDHYSLWPQHRFSLDYVQIKIRIKYDWYASCKLIRSIKLTESQ